MSTRQTTVNIAFKGNTDAEREDLSDDGSNIIWPRKAWDILKLYHLTKY